MNLAKLWAIAQAERRIVFSQFIYWLFVVFAYLQTIITFVVQGLAHSIYSTLSSSADFPAPRNSIYVIGYQYMMIFILAVVFLSLDVRARDSRVRILEILDSRPYSNLDLMFGRFLGWFLCGWTPILVLMFILPALGWLLPYIHIAAGGSIEPLALAGFAFYMAMPAIAFTCAMVMFITLLVNHRIGALAISVILLGISMYMLFFQPFSLALSFDLIGTLQVNQASEWVPTIAKLPWWFQRLGLMVLALGFVLFCAAIHPRLDSSNRRWQTFAAILTTVLGIGLVFTAYNQQNDEFELIAQWRSAHEAKLGEDIPDIVSMVAVVEILPGETLRVDLEIEFRAQTDRPLNSALFSLNPGFEIDSITDSQGNNLQRDFENGLLEIDLATSSLSPNQSGKLHVQFSGKPDILFAYLDTALDLTSMPVTINNRGFLTLDNAVFEQNYVALMPGIHWLPSSGVDVADKNAESKNKDFYHVDLRVRVPENWTVAGPGKRIEFSRNAGTVEFKFSPATAIPEVALMAAPFKSFSSEIGGIDFEILLHPNHDKVMEVMAEAKKEIELWIEDRLSLVRDAGLEYPFQTFTLVEVPNTLRGFAGGWRMDTTFAPPSMVLLREKAFPTARFDVPVGSFDQFIQNSAVTTLEDDPAIAARNRLIKFFSNDFSGGNIFSGFARSLFAHQTTATGDGAIGLEFALRELTNLVVAGERSYFSIGRLEVVDDSLDEIIDQDYQRYKTTTQKVIESFTSAPAVWEAALSLPLSEIDPWEDPELAVDILTLKSGKLAEVIYDILGPQESGQLLAQLLEQHRGGSYTRTDVSATAVAHQHQLAALLEVWITDTGLAGFATDGVELTQLPENENGEVRYQLKMRINNKEPVTGFSRLAWTTEVDGRRTYSDPISLPGNTAIEFGLILTEPPAAAYLAPYLSLNREGYQIQSFNNANIPESDEPEFDGIQLTSVSESTDNRIIIDDLDPGFRVVTADVEPNRGVLGALFDIEEQILDQGLQVRDLGFPSRWSRRIVENAYGKYRHTVAYVSRGDFERKIAFDAKLPTAGRWRLEIYQPTNFFGAGGEDSYGSVNLSLSNGADTMLLEWDSREASAGWNEVGVYDFSAGDISVEFSNKSDGRVVIADAIAWSLVE